MLLKDDFLPVYGAGIGPDSFRWVDTPTPEKNQDAITGAYVVDAVDGEGKAIKYALWNRRYRSGLRFACLATPGIAGECAIRRLRRI